MPIPLDDATTFLTTESAIVRQVYHETFAEQIPYYGGSINRLFKPSKRVIEGDGVNIQTMTGNLHGARFSNNLYADYPTPRAFISQSYKVTLSENPSSNNFRKMGLSLQMTDEDVRRSYSSEIAATNFRQKMISQAMMDVGEKTALHRMLTASASVGTVTGTPKKNDARFLASCGAIAATGGARFNISSGTGSLAYFPANLVLDVYTAGGVFRFSIILAYYNPADTGGGSIGAFGVNANGQADSTIDISAIVSGDLLYISGERNMGLLSVGEWFKEPTTGDSFFGVDRTNQQNTWMLPHKSVPSGTVDTNTLFTKTHLDQAWNEMGYVAAEDEMSGYIALTTLELGTRMRQEIGQDILIPYEPSKSGEPLAVYGFTGQAYRHPTAGTIVFKESNFAPPNKIRFLKVGDWECQYAGESTFQWQPGFIGNWYRMPSSTPGNGLTDIWRMDGKVVFADICLYPRRQMEINGVSAS